ncbi:HlyD family secretion protein [Carnimonas bestiolae]|uniref:HlyD family secretion protein n=1 Tax=Carnimonas bestiolae TaxID=3402172 RepID=UPI003EDC0E40
MSTESKQTPHVQSASKQQDANDAAQQQAATARSYRFQVIRFITIVVVFLLLLWGGSYFIAYTSDAYVDANVVEVAPEVTGKVDHVYVKDNQQVKRGDLLFTLDADEYRLQVESAKGALESARAQVEVDKASIESARSHQRSDQAELTLSNHNLARAQDLWQRGAFATQQLDQQRAAQQQAAAAASSSAADLHEAEGTLKLHQAQLTSAQASLGRAQWRLSRTRLYASQDGVVTHMTLEEGDTAEAHDGVMAVVSQDNWRVMANYKEYFVRHFSPGQVVWVWVDADPWHLYKARVQGVSQAISRQRHPDKLVPYVDPSVDWIRLSRRIPVRLTFDKLPPQTVAGSDARVVAFY